MSMQMDGYPESFVARDEFGDLLPISWYHHEASKKARLKSARCGEVLRTADESLLICWFTSCAFATGGQHQEIPHGTPCMDSFHCG
jgi:hypothetical protein